ncbi:hypothetical protein B0H14DRAFT_2882323, partial [Mycena olivaceomarginata]
MQRVRKLSALRRKDAGYARRCCTLAFTFIPSSHSHSSFFPLHIAPSSYPNDDTDYPPPRFPDAVPTSVPVCASTSTSIALQPGAFTFFSLSFALHFVVSFAFFFCTVFSLVLVACGDGIGGSTCAVSMTCGYPSSITPRPL